MSFPRANRKALLYGVEWQKLRVSLLPEYQQDGGWNTLVGTEANIVSLDAYQRKSSGVEELAVRLYRITNQLNSARLYMVGKGLRNTEQYQFCTTMADMFKGRLVEAHIIHAANLWRWAQVEHDLKWLFETEEKAFGIIKSDLKARAERNYGTKTVKVNELMHFLHLMAKVEADNK